MTYSLCKYKDYLHAVLQSVSVNDILSFHVSDTVALVSKGWRYSLLLSPPGLLAAVTERLR